MHSTSFLYTVGNKSPNKTHPVQSPVPRVIAEARDRGEVDIRTKLVITNHFLIGTACVKTGQLECFELCHDATTPTQRGREYITKLGIG